MRHRWIPALLATVAAAAGFAACGSDTTEPVATPSTLPDATTTEPDAASFYDHPSRADEVVFAYAESGGLTTREFAFQGTPRLLISGDGRLFTPGPQIEIHPGPMLPSIEVRSISEAGIQQLLAAAERSGLFADIDYSAESNIADATTATVLIAAEDETWVHAAYALGFSTAGQGVDESPERQALAGFLDAVQTGRLVDAGQIGPVETFVADGYLIEAIAVDDLSLYGDDPAPTVVDWPAGASLRLADATSCIAVEASEVGPTLTAANRLTFFRGGGVTYQLLAKPILPGDTCPA